MKGRAVQRPRTGHSMMIRGHWHIEALHHIRDLTYREDPLPDPHRQRAPGHGHDT
jgi:hypothetical protein